MSPNEFKGLTKNFHTKVQQKLSDMKWSVPVQILPSLKPNTETIIVGTEVYEIYNDGNLAEWNFVGHWNP